MHMHCNARCALHRLLQRIRPAGIGTLLRFQSDRALEPPKPSGFFIGKAALKVSPKLGSDCETALDQLGAARKAEFLHDLPHVLRVIAVRNQQRIFCVHNHQVLHAYQRNKLARAVNVIVRRVNRHVPV